jgi:hypothetical protein
LASPYVAAIPPEQEAYLAEVHQKVERFLESEALFTLLTLSLLLQLFLQSRRPNWRGTLETDDVSC